MPHFIETSPNQQGRRCVALPLQICQSGRRINGLDESIASRLTSDSIDRQPVAKYPYWMLQMHAAN
jgi:hypothetical protein